MLWSSRFSLPLLGLSESAVLAALDAVLAESDRAASARYEPGPQPDESPVEHVTAALVITADSAAEAHLLLEDLHTIALQRVLALVPPDAPDMGWTSGYQHVEPLTS